MTALDHFHQAQEGASGPSYGQAIAEWRAGHKDSHWIWYMLPQLQGLGHSAMAQHSAIAQRCAIADLEEARSDLADPLLRQRLEEVIAVIGEQLEQPGQTLPHLMGGRLDAAKTISSLTLFEKAG